MLHKVQEEVALVAHKELVEVEAQDQAHKIQEWEEEDKEVQEVLVDQVWVEEDQDLVEWDQEDLVDTQALEEVVQVQDIQVQVEDQWLQEDQEAQVLDQALEIYLEQLVVIH